MYTKRFRSRNLFYRDLVYLVVGLSVKLDNLCLDPINRNSVFVIFKVSLLAASHTRISSRSELMHSFISSTLLLANVILVSSTYLYRSNVDS